MQIARLLVADEYNANKRYEQNGEQRRLSRAAAPRAAISAKASLARVRYYGRYMRELIHMGDAPIRDGGYRAPPFCA